MGRINVNVNGREFDITCGEGEEDRVAELAQYVNGRVTEILEKVGQVGESRVLLMAALVVADELADAYQRIDELEGNSEGRNQARNALEGLASRIESIADRLETA